MSEPLGSATTNTDQNSCVNLQSGRICKPWRVSDAGLAFMAEWESGKLNGTYRGLPVVDGFILKVYDDGYGIPTVALGHKVLPEDNLRVGDIITIERARGFLKKNLIDTERAINKDVMVPLHQYEYDALVSIIWNTGPYHKKHDPWPDTRSHHLAHQLNMGNYDEMSSEIAHFLAERVPSRRKSEANLFSSGVYDARH